MPEYIGGKGDKDVFREKYMRNGELNSLLKTPVGGM